MTYEELLVDSYTLVVCVPFVLAWRSRRSLTIGNILGRIVTLLLTVIGIISEIEMLESYTVLLNENARNFSLDYRGQISFRYFVVIALTTGVLFLVLKSIIDNNKSTTNEF